MLLITFEEILRVVSTLKSISITRIKCTNNHTLAVLATIEHAYLSLDEQAKLSSFDSSLAFEPNLSASWSIEVVSHFEFNEMKNPSEFAVYVLRPESDSYDKASHIYSDFEQILKFLSPFDTS